MKALIFIADDFEDSEFFYPYYRLQEEGFEVDVAGAEARNFTGKHGYAFKANLAFKDANALDYDLLIIPGGKAPETIRLNANALLIARDMLKSNKTVGSICHGAQVLISAQVLSGRKATCFVGVRDDLKLAGAQYSDEEVVIDNNLITSRQPSDLPAFCRGIFNALKITA